MTIAARSSDMNPAMPVYGDLRTNWTREEALALYESPFNDLLFQAQTLHRQNFDPNRVQLSRLLSIKTGGCPRIAAIAASRAIMNPASRPPA